MPKGILSEDTRKLINSYSKSDDDRSVPEDLPFWCYNPKSHDEWCCFWHLLFYPNGGPERDGIYHPCYEYETDLLKALDDHKLIAFYKATGLGVTEFMLMWILWKSYTDPHFQNSEAVIVTGPNVDLAEGLITRAKEFLIKADLPYVEGDKYEFKVRGSKIKCYPSNNLHSARGIPRVSIFFGDESAFFKLRDDRHVRTIGERYIGKSNSWVVWVSTAGESTDCFFYDIYEQGEFESAKEEYYKMERYEEAGLKKDPITKTSIFNPKLIAEAKKQRSYEREYLGIWGHNVGDIFDADALDVMFSTDFTFTNDGAYQRCMGIDPAFGSSKFGIVISEKYKDKFRVIFAKQYERVGYIDMIKTIDSLAKSYGIRHMYVDGSWPEGIRDLQNKYHYQVQGIAWNQYGQKMLDNCAQLLSQNRLIALPHLRDLKIQMSTISLDKDGKPDKRKVSFDLGDALILSLWYFKYGSGELLAIN